MSKIFRMIVVLITWTSIAIAGQPADKKVPGLRNLQDQHGRLRS